MSEAAQWPLASALTGSEFIPLGQGSGAVRATVNQLLSRAAGQVLPFDIGGQRIVTVTSNGVGIGAPSPEKGFHVRGTSANDAAIRVQGVGTGVDGALEMQSATNVFRLSSVVGGGALFTQVGVGDRGKWDIDGNFVIGPSDANLSPTNKVAGITLSPSGLAKCTRNGHALTLHRTDTNGTIAAFVRGTSEVGGISVTEVSTAFNTNSDYRLKVNLEPLTGALDRIDSIPVYRGNFTADPDGPKVDMFLAHEAKAGVPEAVTGEKDAVEEIGNATGYREHDLETGVPILASKETLTGITQAECPEGYTWEKTGTRPIHQQIDQSKLVPLHHAGIQELRAEVRQLQARLAALESAA